MAGLAFTALPEAGRGRDGGADPPLRPGQAYGEARLALRSAGWKPRPRAASSVCSTIQLDRRCHLYPELQSCSQTGPGFCRFEWTSPLGVPHAVITAGGDPGGDPGRLSSWFALP
ncbi:MAG: hypothetical protein ACKO22_12590 [Cyanobium sp.]